jgi:uncharacterized iron-regulated protein
MKYSKLLGVAAVALFFKVATSLAPSIPKADVKPHALCKAVLTHADVDACLVYDTGRTSGTASLSTPEAAQDLLSALAIPADTNVLVLGEAHDNPHHHRLRAKIVASKAKAVVMEHLSADQQAGVDAFNTVVATAASPATLADFKSKVDWANGGWAKYPLDPLLTAVVDARVPIYAGDPPRDQIRQVAKQGSEALPPADRARLALDIALGDKFDAASGKEILEAHCGMLPAEAVPNMAFAQRYRDAHIADATLKAADEHGLAVLLTGNIHARLDRGVPFYIRARAPEKKVVSVVLVEVEEGQTDPAAYVPRDPDGRPAADFIVFTPKAERGDPCAAFGIKK